MKALRFVNSTASKFANRETEITEQRAHSAPFAPQKQRRGYGARLDDVVSR